MAPATIAARVPAAIAALALAAGCTLGPDYRRPETATPAAYRFEQNATADSMGDARWWRVYQDPVLQSLIREGLANNLDVRIAAARIDQARAALGSARLQQLPQASVVAGATRQRTSVYELPAGTPPISNVFSLEGNLSYEIDFWGKYRRATEAARAQLLQSAYAKQDVMAGLVANIATAYFTLGTLDEQLAITRRTLDTRQKFVDLTQAQHDRGTVSELDVATAQAQLAIAKANLPDLKRQIGQVEDQLSVLLGHNPDRIVRDDGTSTDPALIRAAPPVPAAGLPSSLLERRPDLREAEQNLVAANAQVGVAKANLFPTITLTAFGGGVSNALSSLFSGPARTWSTGGDLLQPLLSPQRSLYALDLADAQKRQALLQYQKSVQTAFSRSLGRIDRAPAGCRCADRPGGAGRCTAPRQYHSARALSGGLRLLLQCHRCGPRSVHGRTVAVGGAPQYPAVRGAALPCLGRRMAGRTALNEKTPHPRRGLFIESLLLAAFALLVLNLHPFGSAHLRRHFSQDLVYAWFGDAHWLYPRTPASAAPGKALPPRTVVVLVDEAALALRGARWPVPLSFHAQLLAEIAVLRPRAIMIDFLLIDRAPPDEVCALLAMAGKLHEENIPLYLAVTRIQDISLLETRDCSNEAGRRLDADQLVTPVSVKRQIDDSDFVARLYPIEQAAATGAPGTDLLSAAVRMYCDTTARREACARSLTHRYSPDAGFELAWAPGGDPMNERLSQARCRRMGSPVPAVFGNALMPHEMGCAPVATVFAGTVLSDTQDPASGTDNEQLLNLLDGSIVLIGGNFRASGDLIATPMHTMVPGCVLSRGRTRESAHVRWPSQSPAGVSPFSHRRARL